MGIQPNTTPRRNKTLLKTCAKCKATLGVEEFCYTKNLFFTDNLSRYEYIYLMKHKSETFEKFKEFQSEVENHRNKKIKFLRSDRGGEYLSYEFGLHLKQCGIVSQLTPRGTPQRTDVSERRNRTLLDMV